MDDSHREWQVATSAFYHRQRQIKIPRLATGDIVDYNLVRLMSAAEGETMSTWMTSKLSSAGRLTIPQKLRARLGVHEGDQVLLHEVSEGVILLSTSKLSRPQIASHLLRSLVKGIGPVAEQLGIYDEQDLDPLIQAIRERTYAERYGTAQTP